MKKSMQVVAMVAFLGCFAILVIAAGSRKAKFQENCGEEWKESIQPKEKKSVGTGSAAHADCVAMCAQEDKQEVMLPGQLFHTIL
jgi:hypothetical protein